MPAHPSRGFTTQGMSIDELMEALDSSEMQGHRGGDTFELAAFALNHRVAKAQIGLARITTVASVVSTIVAIAAVVVAIAG